MPHLSRPNLVAIAVMFAAGAVVLTTASPARAATVPVATVPALQAAIAAAKAGDEIVLAPGVYAMGDVACSAGGTAAQPITVRSATPLAAKIELSGLEGFKVTGAHWRFEGLDVRGTCAVDANCEHAFHVTGGAVGFVLRKSKVVDFNAQLKVNASKGAGSTWLIPHGGLVEYNELFDTHARATSNPITKLNIDTGDAWVVRGNVIRDFHRTGSSSATYGAFMKSGGNGGLFERNLVMCTRDELTPGTNIGLSFGGGGTGAQFCAPAFDAAVPCDVEHTGGVMRNNVIAGCSDVGIYLNRAKETKLLFNTLVATTGIDFRFPTTTGEARGNVLTGMIRSRDGAPAVALSDNLGAVTKETFEAMYMAPLAGDLRKKGDLSALLGKATALPMGVTDDYCARPRGDAPFDLGALEHSLGDCVTTTPPESTSQGGDASAGAVDGSTGGPGSSGSSGDGSSGGNGGGDGTATGSSGGGDGDSGCRIASHAGGRSSDFGAGVFALLAAAAVMRRRTSRASGASGSYGAACGTGPRAPGSRTL